MGVVGKVAASDTDGVDFTDLFGYGHQERHGTERLTEVVRIQACDYHPFTPVCKFLGDLHQRHVIELRLIYSNHLDVVGDIQQAISEDFEKEYRIFLSIVEDYFTETYLDRLSAYDKALEAVRVGALTSAVQPLNMP